MGRQDFPAVLIRHYQGQTAIRKLTIRIIHPFPFAPRRAYWREIVLAYLIGNQFRPQPCGRTLRFLRRPCLHANFSIFRHFRGGRGLTRKVRLCKGDRRLEREGF